MIRIYALALLALHLVTDRITTHVSDLVARYDPERETGSVSIEQILWTVGLIAAAGIGIVALTSYVRAEAAKIGGG